MGRVAWCVLVVVVSLLGCKSPFSRTDHVIEFRLAGVDEGANEVRTKDMVVPGTRRKIDVEVVPRFTEADIDSIWIEEDPQKPGRYRVAVCIRPESSDLFRSFTADHVGENVAIIVSGHLTAAPVIREPINGDNIPIVFDLSKEDAESAVESLAPRISARR